VFRLPGIDLTSLDPVGSPGLSVMALGIRPFVTAFGAVELLSFVLPMGRRLRRGGISGRAKLNAFATRAGVGLALLQAAGIAIAFQRQGVVQNPGFLFLLSSVMTLVAGATLAFLIAQFVSRWGIGNGFCMIILFGLVRNAFAAARDFASSERNWNVLEIIVWMILMGLLVRRFGRRPEVAFLGFQQEVILVKLPAFPQGIFPVIFTYTLLAFFSAQSLVFPNLGELSQSPILLLVATVFIATTSLLGFHLFSSRKRLERNLSPRALLAEGEIWTGRSLVETTVLFVVFGAGLQAANWFLDFRFTEILAFPGLVMLVASGFDLVAEWRFRQRHGNSVTPAIEMDNVYCACYLQGLLATHGIHSVVRSFHYRSLFFFFAPLIKMEVLVSATELNHAREIIRPDRIDVV
jgi:hypothetical protein